MATEVDLATPSGDRRNSPIDTLTGYLDQRVDSLVDQSIEIAKSNGYAPFTTTIRAAWVEAVLSVTESLDSYLRSADQLPSGPQATLDYGSDPRFLRMRKIARQHRSLGITLQMYVGLFKHFRNLYLDELQRFPGGLGTELLTKTRDFFDETELSISADWNSSSDNQRLRELQDRTRTLTLDKDRYFAVFESLRNPAFLLDRAYNLVNANQATAELFLGSDAQAGEIIYLRSMRRRKSSLQIVIDQIMDAAKSSEDPVWLDTLNGRRCFDIRTRALHDAVENTTLGHVVILNDVTSHRQEAEEAQQSEQGMSRFLATISHEIRTPLHSVLGATELLRTADQAHTESYLDAIESAGKSLLQTLSNVLDYSKFENERPVPRSVETNLLQEINAFGRIALIGQNRCKTPLSIDLDPGLPTRAQIDWGMTQQVLNNLVSNALRADSGAGVTVSVRKTESSECRDGLRFEVKDHGPGLPSEDAEALFRPFEHTAPRNTGSGGSGLGLAISRHLVEAMQGKIGYENQSNGAMLWFEIPLQPIPAPNQDPGSDREKPPDQQQRAERCLLVDDDPIGIVVTRSQLERLGLSVTTASTVEEAKGLATGSHFDIFVADYLLPDGDGPSLVRDLKTSLGTNARFVALTANVESLAQHAEVFDTVLAKPVGLIVLASAVLGPGARDLSLSKEDTKIAALQGLSPQTISAMVAVFAEAWETFRSQISQRTKSYSAIELADTAHRLAGSCAILGIVEIEPLLRQLETLCRSQHSDEEVAALLLKLDQDLMALASWQRLVADRRSP